MAHKSIDQVDLDDEGKLPKLQLTKLNDLIKSKHQSGQIIEVSRQLENDQLENSRTNDVMNGRGTVQLMTSPPDVTDVERIQDDPNAFSAICQNEINRNQETERAKAPQLLVTRKRNRSQSKVPLDPKIYPFDSQKHTKLNRTVVT